MKPYVAIPILLVALIIQVLVAFADPYVFPIVPGTPEWSSLEYEERVAAMQVPEDILANMTTEDVHLTFLALPAAKTELFFGINPQDGFDRFLVARYNVVDTLLNREDVASVVAAHYLTYVVDEAIYQECDYNMNRSLTELILCQYEIINELNTIEKLALAEQAYDVIFLDQAHTDDCLWDHNAWALIGRIMQIDEFPPFIECIANDPGLESALQGMLWGHPVVFEVVPGYIEYMNDIVGVQDDTTPSVIALDPPYPNPFNPTTTISFTLAEAAPVTLTVYAQIGQKVATLVNGPMSAGTHAVQFDGRGLASGIYVYRFESPGYTNAGKMLLMK